MNRYKTIAIFTALLSASIMQNANAQAALLACSGKQTIQISNILKNAQLKDPGMTQTPVTIKFFSGKENCWTERDIGYDGGYQFFAGPGCGCVTNADKIEVQPLVRKNDKQSAYDVKSCQVSLGPVIQIQIQQAQAPAFDPQSGLVATQGVMQVGTCK